MGGTLTHVNSNTFLNFCYYLQICVQVTTKVVKIIEILVKMAKIIVEINLINVNLIIAIVKVSVITRVT